MTPDDYADGLTNAYGDDNGNRLLPVGNYKPFLSHPNLYSRLGLGVLADHLEEHSDPRHELVRGRQRQFREDGSYDPYHQRYGHLGDEMYGAFQILLGKGQGKLSVTGSRRSDIGPYYHIEWQLPGEGKGGGWVGDTFSPDEAREHADRYPTLIAKQIHQALRDTFRGRY